ncbi:MAG: EAL domain-containing protein [Pseudomonadota bacterium]
MGIVGAFAVLFGKEFFIRYLVPFLLLILALPGYVLPAAALEPVRVSINDIAVDLTGAIDVYRRTDGVLKISTAPDADGIVRRIEVRSRNADQVSHWAVFALANTSDRQIDRLIVAPHYRMVGSNLIWPDLDTERIAAITPSEGFSLDRQTESGADVFLITLDPGAVITLVAEQTTADLPKLLLWEPSAYKDTTNSYTLYHGIILGISGLLAVFLTILFVVKGSAMFPATAALAWGVLAYICVDFGFWNKVINVSGTNDPFWRAGTEVFLSASFLVFIHAYLTLNRWNRKFSIITFGWVLALIILMGIAIFEPGVAAGMARFSFAATVILGAGLIVYLTFQQSDRAVMLIPTWILLGIWLFGAGLAVTGRLENDVIQPALGGGLVLVVLLLCFTVMQHAFSGGALAQGLVSDTERSALALSGAGDVLWDWDVGRDRITVGEEITRLLNHSKKVMNAPPKGWHSILHPNDRDRFTATLAAIIEHKRGRISQAFRLRADDGHFHWFKLRARPMLDTEGEVSRCIGTLTDITDQKKSEERLLLDSVKDNLTGLENRKLFCGRLETIIALAQSDETLRPSVFHIDIDEFSKVNSKYGYSVGDTILLTLSRRLSRLLKTGDSLARISGDQFALLLMSEIEPKKIATFADAIRRTLKAPVEFAEEEIVMSASIGLVSWTREHTSAEEMLRDAELAKGEAKRLGGDCTEPFSPKLRSSRDYSFQLLEDLKKAIEQNQIDLLYQPIVRLEDSSIIGFEALMRWDHPKVGKLMPSDFIPLAEQSGLIQQMGSYVLNKAASEFADMLKTSSADCYVSVNVSSRELLRTDIVNDITNTLRTTGLQPHQLRIEVTESMVMENPEHASQILKRIKSTGVGLSLDDFGTGYSSLSYLLKFPFDTLKIDKSFMQSRLQQEKLVVLKSIITLAHGLNQNVVAEGVEFESDVTDLLQLECEFAQGYLFGEPATSLDAASLLSSGLSR